MMFWPSSSSSSTKETVLLTHIKTFLGTHLAVELAKNGFNVKGILSSTHQGEVLEAFLREHLNEDDSLDILGMPPSDVDAWKDKLREAKATNVIISMNSESLGSGHAQLSRQKLKEKLIKETETLLDACIESTYVQRVIVLSNIHAVSSHEGGLQTQLWLEQIAELDEDSQENSKMKNKTLGDIDFPLAACELYAEKQVWNRVQEMIEEESSSSKVTLVHITPSLLGPLLTDHTGSASATFLSVSEELLHQAPLIMTNEQENWKFAIMDVRDAANGVREILESLQRQEFDLTSVYLPSQLRSLRELITVTRTAIPSLMAATKKRQGILSNLTNKTASPALTKILHDLSCFQHIHDPLPTEAAFLNVPLANKATAALLQSILTIHMDPPKLKSNTTTVNKAKDHAAHTLNKKRVEAAFQRRRKADLNHDRRSRALALASTLPYSADAASALEHGHQGPNGFGGMFGNPSPPWHYGKPDIPVPRTQFWRFYNELFYSVMAHFWSLDVSGTHNIPRAGQPFLIISNHGSHIDPFLIGCNLPGSLSNTMVAMVKADFDDLEGVWGSLGTRWARGIPVERFKLSEWASVRESVVNKLATKESRNKKSMAAAVKVLKEYHRPMVMFPEGTRTRDGKLLPFHSGAIHIAREAGVPILPVNIRNAFQNWPANRPPKLWGTKKVMVTYGPVIAHEQLSAQDFDANRLRSIVESLSPEKEGDILSDTSVLRPLGDSGGYDTIYSHDNRHVRVVPRNAEEVVQCVQQAIREGRVITARGTGYSFGGHTIAPSHSEKSMQIDMLQMTECTYDSSTDCVTAEAGAKWIQVNSLLRTLKRRAAASTSYDRFSVGGSVAVNGHGRGGGSNPSTLGEIVVRLTVVTADGELRKLERPSQEFLDNAGDDLDLENSPDECLFRLIVGGWGMFGIIVDATFETVPDVEVNPCHLHMIDAHEFGEWWTTHHHDQVAAFGRLTTAAGDRWQRALAQTWVVSDKQHQSLAITSAKHSTTRAIIERFVLTIMMKGPRFILEPVLSLRFYVEVIMRLLVIKQELASKALSENFDNLILIGSKTDVVREGLTTLIEVFVPISQLSKFLSKGAATLERYPDIPLINTTLRIVQRSQVAYLSYMPPKTNEPAAALVLFLRRDDDERIESLTKALTEDTLSVGGNFYLPYLRHPTKEQVRQAYSSERYDNFVHARTVFDPKSILRSAFADHYFPTPDIAEEIAKAEEMRAKKSEALFSLPSATSSLGIHGVKIKGPAIMSFVTQNERQVAESIARVTTTIPLLGCARMDNRSGCAVGISTRSHISTLIGVLVVASLSTIVFWLCFLLGYIGIVLSILLIGRAALSFRCDVVLYRWYWDTDNGAFVVKAGSVGGRREMVSLRPSHIANSVGKTDADNDAGNHSEWELTLEQQFPTPTDSLARAKTERLLSNSLGKVLNTVYYHISCPDLIPEAMKYKIDVMEHFVECKDGVIIRLRRVTKKTGVASGGKEPSPSAAIMAPAWDSDTDSLTPFANHLLFTNPTVTEVWLLDHRGGSWWAQTHPGRAGGEGWCYSQVGLFDWPAAIEYVRDTSDVGDSIHCIGQCMGSVGLSIAAAHGKLRRVKSATCLSTVLANEFGKSQLRARCVWDMYERLFPSWGQVVASPGAAPLTRAAHSFTKLWHSRLCGCPACAVLNTSLGRCGEEGPFLHRNLPADRHWRLVHTFGGEFGLRVTQSLLSSTENPGSGGIQRLFINSQARALYLHTEDRLVQAAPLDGARHGDALGMLQREVNRPPMAFMGGELNPMMGTTALHTGLSLMMAQEKCFRIETKILKDVGHFDALWGRTAPDVTFEPVANFIQSTAVAESPAIPSKQALSENAAAVLVAASDSCEIGAALKKKLASVVEVLTVRELAAKEVPDLVASLQNAEVVVYAAPIGDLGSGPCFCEEMGDKADPDGQCDHIQCECPWTRFSGPKTRQAPLNSQPRVQRAVNAFQNLAEAAQQANSIKRIVLASSALAVCPSDALSRTKATKTSPVYTELDAASWNKDGGGAGAAVAVEVAAAKARKKLAEAGVSMEVICFGEPWGQASLESRTIMDPFERAKNFRFAALNADAKQNVAWAVTPANKIVDALVARATATDPGAFRTVAVSAVVNCRDVFNYASYDPTISHLTKQKSSRNTLLSSNKGQRTVFALKRGGYFTTATVSIEFRNEEALTLVPRIEGPDILDLCATLFHPQRRSIQLKIAKKESVVGEDVSDASVPEPQSAKDEENNEADNNGLIELYDDFERASKYTITHGAGWRLQPNQKLHLYALYKYATEGSSEGHSPPSMFQAVAKAKYNAWAGLGVSMTQEEAMHQYIDLVETFAPGWND